MAKKEKLSKVPKDPEMLAELQFLRKLEMYEMIRDLKLLKVAAPVKAAEKKND